MKYQFLDWDSIPDVINKDQFYRICHISKSTALHLLKSGKIPCEWTGKKTRCYKIKKEDVKEYLQTRAVYPELYSAPSGWYGNHYVAKLSKELPEEVLGCMHVYYSKLLKNYEPKEKPDGDFYEAKRKLSAIGNNINQLAVKAHALGFVDAPMLKTEALRWHQFQADVEATFLRPQQSNLKWK